MINQAHPWFKDVAWDKLYEMEAAFKPKVNGELDTQNFMKFDEVRYFTFVIGESFFHIHFWRFLYPIS